MKFSMSMGGSRLRVLLLLLGCAAGTLPALATPPAAAAAKSNAAPSLLLTSCQLEDPEHVSVVSAECGDLSVLEDPSNTGGRRISLHVARVPAINRRKQPDPLFVLAGGPGMAATTFYASVSSIFERIHRDRDIILVDQRGTGQSNPLNCKQDDVDVYRATDAEIRADAKRCLDVLQKSADVRFYTTSVAVQDLDRVREELGYESINLYGSSYGTRIAQHYLRRFPQRTRVLILDGVVPPQLTLGPSSALDAEQALSHIFARCVSNTECHKRFGDPATAYHALRTALVAHPVSVNLPDPTSGAMNRFDFTEFHLATVLRLSSYASEQAALLPLMLNMAATSADFSPLASQFLLINRQLGDELAYGMHNSVVCSEDVPFYDYATIDRAEMEKTYLGGAQFDGLRSICSVWPHGPIDPDFHQPLHSDTPALLMSGSDDPVTPPTDGEEAARGFTHSLHIVLQGSGHGQLTAPCVARVMADFVSRGKIEGLDVGCVRDDVPLPFFTSLGGPAP